MLQFSNKKFEFGFMFSCQAWLHFRVEAILTKIAILCRQTNHAWLQFLHAGDLNENGNVRKEKLVMHHEMHS